MQQLGINSIRIYNLDPNVNHDECVSIFNAVGIYLLLDVNSPLPNESLNPGDLGSSYNAVYLERIFSIVEAFKDYPNVFGFFGANEVMNDVPSGGVVPPYLRAVTRDLKNYIAKHSARKIPVGYSAADVRPILADSWSYLSCNLNTFNDDEDMSRIDFFGLNSYSWCGGDADFYTSEYDKLVAQFSNTTIPVFLSEYGCNKVQPRVFDEVLALYGPQMTGVMSGGLVYQWTEDTNDFGLINVMNDDAGTTSLMIDYDNLQKQYNKLDVKSLQSSSSFSSRNLKAPPTCHQSLISSPTFASDFASIPDPPAGAQKLIDEGIPNPPARGKTIPVKDLKVTTPVFSSSGKEVKNLAITLMKDGDEEGNMPSGQDIGIGARPSETSATAPAPASSSKTNGGGGVGGAEVLKGVSGNFWRVMLSVSGVLMALMALML